MRGFLILLLVLAAACGGSRPIADGPSALDSAATLVSLDVQLQREPNRALWVAIRAEPRAVTELARESTLQVEVYEEDQGTQIARIAVPLDGSEVSVPLPAPIPRVQRYRVELAPEETLRAEPSFTLDLPMPFTDSDAYHRRAQEVFATAVAVLREVTGDSGREPSLRAMEAEGFGFMALGRGSRARIVEYQDPWLMDERARAVNRAVMQVESDDERMRHAQMMLYWYLPHEVVHTAALSRVGTWLSEYVANALQPAVTDEVLRRLGETAYSARAMGWIYERYEHVLRPLVVEATLARIEPFYRNTGYGPPFAVDVWDAFQQDTPAYVYFGARINRLAQADQLGLAQARALLALEFPPYQIALNPSLRAFRNRTVECQMQIAEPLSRAHERVAVSFHLSPSGDAEQFTAEVPNEDEALRRCAENAFRGQTFPPPNAATEIRYRFPLTRMMSPE